MDVLDKVVENSSANSTVLVFVIVAVVLILLAYPMYKLVVNSQTTKRKQYLERDGLIIDVIKDNAIAITKLCTVLEGSNKSCGDCKKEQLAHFERLHTNGSDVLSGVNEIKTIVNERLERRG